MASTAINLRFEESLTQVLAKMPSVSLAQMESVSLMSRIDTKYLTTKQGLLRLLERVVESYFVQSIDSQEIMRYQTVYLDTVDHFFYRQHFRGALPRMKLRMRTYLDSDGLTFFEIKHKNNRQKTRKKRIPISSVETAATTGAPEFLYQNTGLDFYDYRRAVQNKFRRVTLVNRAMTERLTIDFDIDYLNFETGGEDTSGDLVVIELKRGGPVYSPIRAVLTQLHIHPCGYSKYMAGAAMTNPSLRANKRKQVYISKVLRSAF